VLQRDLVFYFLRCFFVQTQEVADRERSILIHSLRNANLPRFLAEDAPLFNNIMSDLFPGIPPSRIGNPFLEVKNERREQLCLRLDPTYCISIGVSMGVKDFF